MTERSASEVGQGEEHHSVALSEDVRRALTFQSYSKATTIDGVKHCPLRKHRSENGWFAELFRLAAGSPENCEAAGDGWDLRQLSMSHASPFRINAFHIHPVVEQNEIWTVASGQLLVWLVDCRKGSPTEGVRQKVVLNGESPAQLFIPAGVAHGYRAADEGALLIYAMDQQFDAANPNEGRLPWDHFGADLWEEDRG